MQKIVNLMTQIPAVLERRAAEPHREIRLRVCRVGDMCPSCGGAAWIQAEPYYNKKGELRFRLPRKPRTGCPPRRIPSEASQRVKAALVAAMPAWVKPLIKF